MATVVLALVVIAGATMGQTGRGIVGVLKCRKLEVYDDTGNKTADLGTGSDHTGELMIYNGKTGAAAAILGGDNLMDSVFVDRHKKKYPTSEIEYREPIGRLLLCDTKPEGRSVAVIGGDSRNGVTYGKLRLEGEKDMLGGVWIEGHDFSGTGGEIRVTDRTGKNLCKMSADERGGRVDIRSTAGLGGTVIANTENGGIVIVSSVEGKLMTAIDNSENGGTVTVYNKTQESICTIKADEYGNGVVGAWNRKGEGRTLKPGP